MKAHERDAVVARAKELIASEPTPDGADPTKWHEHLYARALAEIRAGAPASDQANVTIGKDS